MQKSKLINILLWLSRILFGTVFIFSGFVKAIDPLGSVYKFQDYFLAFNTEWLFPAALPMAILLSGLEFVIGVLVLVGIKMKYGAWGGLFFMVFFTPLTLYIAIFNPVSHCGCFGDALVISNWSTFYKNVILLAASILIYIYRNGFKPLWTERNDWFIAGFVSVFIFWLSVYCLRNLPIIDFLPWKIGNNIKDLVVPTPEIADVYLIYRNKETGEHREYSPGDLPWDDPEWMQKWEFVNQRRVVTREFKEAPISNFSINDEFGDGHTESYIGNPDFQFLLIAYDLNRAKAKAFERNINEFAENAMDDNNSFIVLTGSSFSEIDLFRHKVQAPYPFYQSDEISLKTIIRSNPGLLLMKNGTVLAKWHWRNIPEYMKVKEHYLTME